MTRNPYALAAAFTLATAAPAFAQSWVTPAPGDWFTPANWSGSMVPNAVGATADIGDVASGGSLTSGGNFSGASTVTLGSLSINRATAGPGLFFFTPDFIFDNGTGADVFLEASGILALEFNSNIELRGQLISTWTASNGKINGTISGNFGITHNPPFEAILELGGTNTYTGETRILNGRIRIKNASALGSPASGTFVDGATSSLIYDGPTGPTALEALTLENNGRLWLTPVNITSDISLSNTGNITTWFDNTVAEVSGTISGDHFIKSSAQSNQTADPTAESILYLSNSANTYTNGTTIRSGVLAIETDGSLGTAGTNITFDTVGFSDGPPALATRSDTTVSRPISLLDDAGLRADESTVAIYPQPITGNRALTINAPAGTNAIANGFSDWTGTVVLSADNSYTGGTTVRLGTLIVDNTLGSATGSGPVTIEENATLAGDGLIAGPVNMTAGGALQPGAPVGSIITGPITMGPTTTTTIQITGSNPGQFDRVLTSGPTTVDGELIILNSAASLTPGDVFDIIDAASITGTFATESIPPEFTIDYLSDRVRLTYTGATGCAEDLNADNAVDAADLAILLAAWAQTAVPADFNGGGVDSSDLAILLAAWGPCS